jgi:hypothetical protein
MIEPVSPLVFLKFLILFLNKTQKTKKKKLKAPSFEDSQVDQYQAYASPYALYWPANKKLMGELSSYDLGNAANNNNNNNNLSLTNNLSDIERGRGGVGIGVGGGPIASPTNDTASNLIQVPVGRVCKKSVCLF